MLLKPLRNYFLSFLLVIGYQVHAQGQQADTLILTLKQAENQFLKNNLQLIAQRYNIDNANAAVITAKLFPNPDLSFSNGIAASDATQGPAYKEQSFAISQLFATAGKRNKSVRLAKIGVEQAKYQFFDLLRTLKFMFFSDFYTIYFRQQSAKVYNQEIVSLGKTLTVFKDQYQKGNIAQKEVLRIQSQLYSQQTEYNSLVSGIDTTESELKMLIKAPVSAYLDPQLRGAGGGGQRGAATPYQRLLDSAYVNRYDLRYSKAAVEYNNMNLQVQKATAVPDLSLSQNYDKLGAYGNNFLGAGVGFSLPFYSRNQGNFNQ